MAGRSKELAGGGNPQDKLVLSPFAYQLPSPGELALLRDKACLTKKEVAERMDVNRHTVRNWETGDSSPRLDELQQLLGVYRVEIETEVASG